MSYAVTSPTHLTQVAVCFIQEWNSQDCIFHGIAGIGSSDASFAGWNQPAACCYWCNVITSQRLDFPPKPDNSPVPSGLEQLLNCCRGCYKTHFDLIWLQHHAIHHTAIMSATKSISFEELVKDSVSTVRVTADGLLYAVDIVVVVTGKNRDDSAKVIRSLPNDIFSQVCFLYVFLLV